MKAVITAAGYGTRFLPFTKSVPKEMLPIINRPSIEYVVREAVMAGCDDIIIIVGRNKDAIINHFDKNDEMEYILEKNGDFKSVKIIRDISNLANIHYIRQKEALGLGHAILCAQKHIGNEPFAVLLGDDVVRGKTPCVKQLLDQYEKTYSTTLAIESVPIEETKRYGVIKGELCDDGLYEVRDLIEKPQTFISSLAMIGRYILTPEIFNAIEKTKPGYNNEIQLTDALKLLLNEQPIYAYKFEGRRHDVGTFGGLLKANLDYAKDNPEYKNLLDEFCNESVSK